MMGRGTGVPSLVAPTRGRGATYIRLAQSLINLTMKELEFMLLSIPDYLDDNPTLPQLRC